MYKSSDGQWRERKETPQEYWARHGYRPSAAPRPPRPTVDIGPTLGIVGILAVAAAILFGTRR